MPRCRKISRVLTSERARMISLSLCLGGESMKRLSVMCAVAMITLSCGSLFAADAPIAKRQEWQVTGALREGLVYAPENAKKTDTPVIFAFHGHGGNMRHAARVFAYETLWPEAIVVYPQGLNTPGKLTDPDGKKPGWQHSLGDQDDRDLKFFDTVLESLKKDYHVDARRIYSTGHSNGAAFTYLLAQNRSGVFAAIAPSAATAGQGWRSLKPLPILHVAGENDQLVKYAWQQLTMTGIRKLNGCDDNGQPWAKDGPLVGTVYASSKGAPFVAVIHPGTHKFPEEAPRLIVKFFKEHEKKADGVP